jgi:hypothetical protein
MPVPAPRQKKEQISPRISNMGSSKTGDNIFTGNCAGSEKYKNSYNEEL